MFTTQAFPLFINTLYSSTWLYGALGCQIYACIGGIFGNQLRHFVLDRINLISHHCNQQVLCQSVRCWSLDMTVTTWSSKVSMDQRWVWPYWLHFIKQGFMSILNIRTFANLNYGLTETYEVADCKEFMEALIVKCGPFVGFLCPQTGSLSLGHPQTTLFQ